MAREGYATMLTELIGLCADVGEIGKFRGLIRRNATIQGRLRPTVMRRVLIECQVYPDGKISRPSRCESRRIRGHESFHRGQHVSA